MSRLRAFLKAFSGWDRGQDLAEYCLLTALVALIGMAVLVRVSGGMQAVWGGANASLVSGSHAVNGAQGSSDTTTSQPVH
jgi:Flp pilus assembly pilin Flp